MQRIKELNRYQKGLLLLLCTMIVIFGVIYAVASSKVGFLYKDVILLPSEVNGATLYSGRIKGQDCCFTVTADKIVTFQCDEKSYGPYTMREDSSALPEGESLSDRTVGVEIREKETILFRGSIYKADNFLLLTNEDGTSAGFSITATMSDGTTYDEYGNVVDPMEPSLSDIISLIDGPELNKKGDWIQWVIAVIVSLVTAVSILFADELFRWNLAFQIRNANNAEPSEWELASRYIGWTVLTLLALGIYIGGLCLYS